jgi:single-strand DNA-binding protein
MIRALITGTLYGDPQARTSQKGSVYATAKVRADGKDGSSVWCSIVAFGEVADRLMTLAANQAVSVSGKAEVNGWLDKAGEPKAGLSLVVDELATLKGKPKPQSQTQGEPQRESPQRQPRAKATPAPVTAGFDDELPDWQ